MLMFTRRLGESFIMDDEVKITVTILFIRKNQVGIGVEASKDIEVYREELENKIFEESVAKNTMLKVTRKLGETFVINSNIKLTILSVNSSQARLGVDAPRNIDIYRTELGARNS